MKLWHILAAAACGAVVTAAARGIFTSTDHADLEWQRRADQTCAGYLAVAKTAADTAAIFSRGAGWVKFDGSVCAEYVGRSLAPRPTP